MEQRLQSRRAGPRGYLRRALLGSGSRARGRIAAFGPLTRIGGIHEPALDRRSRFHELGSYHAIEPRAKVEIEATAVIP